jgi:hypothetical protein
MQRRILLIAVVFVAGFGIGYGITWLFVGSPERGEAALLAQPRPEAVAGQATAAQPAGVTAAPSADVVEPVAADVAATPDTASPQPDTAVAAVADTGPTALEVAAAPDVTVSPEVAAAPAESPLDRCLNKVCRVDFGGVSGGISVRKGKLEHGAEVVWDRDFGRADKVGTLDSEKNVKVEVLAIGLTDGEPSAAYISRKLKRSTQTGVIALKIGERRLSLVPIEE